MDPSRSSWRDYEFSSVGVAGAAGRRAPLAMSWLGDRLYRSNVAADWLRERAANQG